MTAGAPLHGNTEDQTNGHLSVSHKRAGKVSRAHGKRPFVSCRRQQTVAKGPAFFARSPGLGTPDTGAGVTLGRVQYVAGCDRATPYDPSSCLFGNRVLSGNNLVQDCGTSYQIFKLQQDGLLLFLHLTGPKGPSHKLNYDGLRGTGLEHYSQKVLVSCSPPFSTGQQTGSL